MSETPPSIDDKLTGQIGYNLGLKQAIPFNTKIQCGAPIEIFQTPPEEQCLGGEIGDFDPFVEQPRALIAGKVLAVSQLTPRQWQVPVWRQSDGEDFDHAIRTDVRIDASSSVVSVTESPSAAHIAHALRRLQEFEQYIVRCIVTPESEDIRALQVVPATQDDMTLITSLTESEMLYARIDTLIEFLQNPSSPEMQERVAFLQDEAVNLMFDRTYGGGIAEEPEPPKTQGWY